MQQLLFFNIIIVLIIAIYIIWLGMQVKKEVIVIENSIKAVILTLVWFVQAPICALFLQGQGATSGDLMSRIFLALGIYTFIIAAFLWYFVIQKAIVVFSVYNATVNGIFQIIEQTLKKNGVRYTEVNGTPRYLCINDSKAFFRIFGKNGRVLIKISNLKEMPKYELVLNEMQKNIQKHKPYTKVKAAFYFCMGIGMIIGISMMIIWQIFF